MLGHRHRELAFYKWPVPVERWPVERWPVERLPFFCLLRNGLLNGDLLNGDLLNLGLLNGGLLQLFNSLESRLILVHCRLHQHDCFLRKLARNRHWKAFILSERGQCEIERLALPEVAELAELSPGFMAVEADDLVSADMLLIFYRARGCGLGHLVTALTHYLRTLALRARGCGSFCPLLLKLQQELAVATPDASSQDL